MGLESFKTEGPRTYSKGSPQTSSVSTGAIHIVNGVDEEDYDFLLRHEVHTVFETNESMSVKLPGGGPYFICADCGKISKTYEAMLKTDLVDFKDKDWCMNALSSLVDEYKSIDYDVYHDDGLEAIESGETGDTEETNTSTQTSSDDDDFNSGLGSFT